jgi:FMN-dependent dehydrogenase
VRTAVITTNKKAPPVFGRQSWDNAPLKGLSRIRGCQRQERKAAESLPEWVYRYVASAAGDGRTERADVDVFSRYGTLMMVIPLHRDLSINLFGKRLSSPIFMAPVGLVPKSRLLYRLASCS